MLLYLRTNVLHGPVLSCGFRRASWHIGLVINKHIAFSLIRQIQWNKDKCDVIVSELNL